MRITKRSKLVVGTVAAALVIVGLWVLSNRSVSPDQRLAGAEPPPAATVDVAVEERVLEDTVLVRGQVAVRGEVPVMAPGGAIQGDGPSAEVAIIGALPYGVGVEVPPGGVVAVVSDRPVLVVPMSLPMHRTLTPGVEGADVERLQQSLVLLGYDVAVNGHYDAGTRSAVTRLYRDRGFEPITTGPELDEAVEAATAAADGAATAVQHAEHARNVAAAGGDQAQFDAAQGELNAARAGYAAARASLAEASAKVGPVVPLGELVGVAEFPVVVSRLPRAIGSVADGPVVVLSPSDLVVQAPMDATRSTVLSPGMRGTATVEGEEVEFEVEVAEPSGTGAGGAGGEGGEAGPSGGSDTPTMIFTPLAPLRPELLGQPVLVEIVLAASDEAVMAVPTGTVRSDGDGPYLLVVDDTDDTRRVGFTPGLSVGGWVEVTAPADDLEVGDVVRAG